MVIASAAGLWWAWITLDVFAIRRPIVEWVHRVLTARWGVGAVDLSLGGLLAFAAAVAASFGLSRLIRFLLAEDVYPRVHLARGVPYLISTVLHYAILFVGFLVAVAALGYDMTKFTILAGAFGVGLGFGMQNIVNNFVSGLILLFERPIQVGDVVELDPMTVGTVVRIGIRASIVRTSEAAEIIVPNGLLIANRVTNWTLSNRQRGFVVPVSVAGSGVEPEAVIELLTRVARETECVAKAPVPQAYVTEFLPAGGLKFDLRVWTDRFDDWVEARSKLVAAVHAELTAKGIQRV
jgi:small-conductance mechanosensitive channel